MPDSKLVIEGGTKLRQKPWPSRSLLGEEEKAAVNALFDSSLESGNAFGYNGEVEEAYCKEFAEYLGGGYADAVNSGTSAVFVALRALDLPMYSEVIVGAVTDPGGMMPIPMMGCIPVPADIAPNSYSTGPEQVEQAITAQTSAILVSHIGGEPADIEGILEVANKHGIPVVEDCAQAPGALVNGRLVGTFGITAAFSTMNGKHFCTGGQGGVGFTKDAELYKKIRWASDRGKAFGLPAGSKNKIASLNFNLGDLGAAIGREQLKKLPGIVARRRGVVAKLRAATEGLKSVSVPVLAPGVEASYWFLRMNFDPTAVTCDRSVFMQALEAEGLPMLADYVLINPHTFDWFTEKRVFGTPGFPWTSPEYKGDPNRVYPCPNIEKTHATSFRLSIHESWGDEEVADAVAIFSKVETAFKK